MVNEQVRWLDSLVRHLLDLVAVVERGDNLPKVAPDFFFRNRTVLLDTFVYSVLETTSVKVLRHKINPVAVRIVDYFIQWNDVSMDHFLEDGEFIAI